MSKLKPTTNPEEEVIETKGVEENPVQHSKDFEKIKKYYEDGFWTKKMVKNAVVKGKITAEEYEEIVGEPYPN